ncbi:MAG TPA: hypothetical protein PKA95_06800 [Thermomicrobiales bacterium]|nr:hypothetical protein [Thermomicrobiales bacterium]
MADFVVSMSPDELPDEVLREAVARALRGAEGRDVETSGQMLALVVDEVDWWEIAAAHPTLIEAVWRDADDVDGLVAFDFDTGEWFVIEADLLDRQTLLEVVPADERDAGFRQLVRSWIWRHGWARGRFPTAIRSPFTGEAWLARELAMTLRGNEVALAAHLADCDVADAVDPAEAMEHWDHAVMVEGGAPVIDLFEWAAGGEHGAFAAWLDDVAVAWDDTGQPVSHEDALRLWLVCQYLALP